MSLPPYARRAAKAQKEKRAPLGARATFTIRFLASKLVCAPFNLR
jgi:hypothetical protein